MGDDFTLDWTTTHSPAEVFAAVLDVHAWWGRDIIGRASTVGDTFEFEVPGMHWTRIEVTRVEPDRLVEWRVLDNHMTFVDDQSEWVGSTIRFELEPEGSGCRLAFTHVGLTPRWECFDKCNEGWNWYAGSSLHRLVDAGAGAPYERVSA